MTRDRIRRAKAAAKPALARPANSSSINFWEALELRQLLSASHCSIVTPAVTLEHLAPSVKGAAVSVQGITPSQIKSAYGFTGVTQTGAGQTIAIIDAYNDPNIASDLGTFDSEFGLAAPPSFKVVSQTGGSTLPATNAAWAQETALDVEWAHAIAPDANILLVEANNESTSNLVKAVNYARNDSGVSVVSMSWGGTEMANETSYDQYFTTPTGHTGVSFVAAAGDEGAAGGAEWPAVSPNVIAVGGTTLTLNGNSYGSETVWSDTSDGTSSYESTPGYQSSLGVSGRTTADVSYDADPNTGFATYDSLSYQGEVGWAVTGGTSAGTPQWAGIIALADQGRVSAGKGTLDSSTQTLPALYSIASNATTYANDFNDITTGSNGSTYGGYGGGGYTGAGGGYGGGGGYTGGGGGGYYGGGYGGYGGYGGGGFGGYGGHHHGWDDGYAFVHAGYGEITSAVATAATTTGVSLTSATTGYDGPTGLGTPKAAGLISSLISYGTTVTVSVKKISPAIRVNPAITRARPAVTPEDTDSVQSDRVLPATYAAVATPSISTSTSLNRPEPRVELETAVGLARPSSSAAATADSGESFTDAGLGLLSGFLTETQTGTFIAKVATALKPAAQSTAAIAEAVVIDARQAAAKFAATTAPLILAPEQVFFSTARIDANARFNDALSSLTDELAAIPRKVGAAHSNARAWAVTGIVLAADAVLLARYRSKRAAVFNERMKIAM